MINYQITLITILCLNLAAMAQPDFYYLQVRSENANVQCFLNGFPVYELENESPISNAVPVQMYMVGKNNQLTIQMNAINEQTPKVTSKILPYQKGDMVDSYSDEEGIVSLDLEGKSTTDKSVTFNNERFDYSDIFIASPTLTEDEVLDYSKKLYSLIRGGNGDKFVDEMSVKLSDFAEAMGHPEKDIRNNLSSGLEASFFKEELPAIKNVKFTAVPYCKDHVWELLIDDHSFLYKKEEGGYSSMKVYVAEVDGKLSIVR